jgi:hypothetical protein
MCRAVGPKDGLYGGVGYMWTGWRCGLKTNCVAMRIRSGLYGGVGYTRTGWRCGLYVDRVAMRALILGAVLRLSCPDGALRGRRSLRDFQRASRGCSRWSQGDFVPTIGRGERSFPRTQCCLTGIRALVRQDMSLLVILIAIIARRRRRRWRSSPCGSGSCSSCRRRDRSCGRCRRPCGWLACS